MLFAAFLILMLFIFETIYIHIIDTSHISRSLSTFFETINVISVQFKCTCWLHMYSQFVWCWNFTL